MANSLKVACVGEAMIELSFDGATPLLNFAGDTLNTAIYLRRNLPLQHNVSFVSVLGNDPFSMRMLDFIAAEGVSTDHISIHPKLLPGLYAIDTAPDGERSFLYWRENSAARSLFENGFARLESFDVIYFSAITLAILPSLVREGFLAWLSSCEKLIVFDSNYRPMLWPEIATARSVVEQAWRLADIGLPSLDDEMALFSDKSEDQVVSRISDCGVQYGALKRGARGPRPFSTEPSKHTIFQEATLVVDTTAAGDSFNGAFLGSYLKDGDTMKAMTKGHECSLAVIRRKGAIIPSE